MVLDADAKRYRLVIYDANGNIIQIPQDAVSWSFTDVVNGGSAEGTVKFPRRFVDQGWINYNYRVQLYLDDSIDPWYDGYVVDFDPEQQTAQTEGEYITVYTEGWQTWLGNAIVDEVLTPSVGAGTMNADTYVNHLISTYMDHNTFTSAYTVAMPIALDQLTFDGEPLNTCIDDIINQVQDNTGRTFEWWVRGVLNGKPGLVIQNNQNPNNVTSPSYYTPAHTKATNFMLEFKDSTIYEYKIQNSSKDLYNMIALFGGQLQNVQVWGAFKDSTSISLYGLRQKKVTNSNLLSPQSLTNYATAYLLLNGYPQPQGSFKKWVASDFARAGQWYEIAEPGLHENTYAYIVQGFQSTTTSALSAGATSIPLASTTGLSVGQPLAVGSNPPIAVIAISGVTVTLARGLTNAVVSGAQANSPSISSTHSPNLRQCRSIKVITSIQEGMDRIEQEVYTTAPRPFIDHAYYSAINTTTARAAAQAQTQAQTNLINTFIQQGGDYVP